uniref:Uncharacterized protein n=1 Tax=Rhizophora mucronata TaxID=61149 RepID=A0A2P2QF72_RHIMU
MSFLYTNCKHKLGS